MKTKILLIGGAGYIGTVVTEFFNNNKKKLEEFNSKLYENYLINL